MPHVYPHHVYPHHVHASSRIPASHVHLTRASGIHASPSRKGAYTPSRRTHTCQCLCTSCSPRNHAQGHSCTPHMHLTCAPHLCTLHTRIHASLAPSRGTQHVFKKHAFLLASQALSGPLKRPIFGLILASFWPQKWHHFGLILARAFSQNPCNHWTLETLCLQGFDDMAPANRCNHWLP